MWFQPIIDTAGHELIGHECISVLPEEHAPADGELEKCDWAAIGPGTSGLCFVRVPQTSIARSLRELWVAGLKARNFVFQIAGPWTSSNDLVREYGASLALEYVDTSSFQRIRDLRPNYIKLDPGLTWNSEEPVCASTIRKVIELADKFNIKTIATGVDRPRMVENLWLLGVEIMQGDLFGKASPEIIRMSSDLARLSRALEPVLIG
jgi:EAL domain-containing protein (putative c-di-GMP-specific phosphodiesterase class I)